MKLLTAVAVIALASATAAFADPGTSAPVNLNSANQSSSMSNQAMPSQPGQKPAQQGAMSKPANMAKSSDIDAKAKADHANMAKSQKALAINGSKQDVAERAQTQQLNDQQLANASKLGMSAQSGSMSQQTAARPPEDSKLNCIENTTGCTPAVPPGDH